MQINNRIITTGGLDDWSYCLNPIYVCPQVTFFSSPNVFHTKNFPFGLNLFHIALRCAMALLDFTRDVIAQVKKV